MARAVRFAFYVHATATDGDPFSGDSKAPVRHIEPLDFENVHLATRSYK